ncbi:skin secretory protein xP2-like [Cavia porcellus]|uniref:skin secretory protein xP2-like n=1 Tax=Cavia porcellus TaxID=10141 RepID=UPI002FE2D546
MTGVQRAGRSGSSRRRLRDAGIPTKRPEAPPSGSTGAAPKANGSPASASPAASREEAGPAQPTAAALHLPIHGPDRRAQLTGSPPAQEAGGGSWVASGTGERRLSGAPAGRRWKEEWETGAGTEHAPATTAPPPSQPASASPPRLAPPPQRRRPPSGPAPALLPTLGSAPRRPLPAGCAAPRLLAHLSARVRAPTLAPAFAGARALCFALGCPPSRGPAGLPASRPGAARLQHFPLLAGRALGLDSGE